MFVASTPSRLHILYHCLTDIEAYDQVAIWHVKTLFSYRCSKEAVELALAELHQSHDLISKGSLYVVESP